tara:strand:- start:34 stop:372 length:339 start_codon:yes stop_codon:yes gene_type:complete
MSKMKLITLFFIFSIFLSITSVIKNKTRSIEKKLNKIEVKINKLEKDLNEVQLDYFYLSSPDNLSKKIDSLGIINYIPMDFSKIYLNYDDFIISQKKITTLRVNNENKSQKK